MRSFQLFLLLSILALSSCGNLGPRLSASSGRFASPYECCLDGHYELNQQWSLGSTHTVSIVWHGKWPSFHVYLVNEDYIHGLRAVQGGPVYTKTVDDDNSGWTAEETKFNWTVNADPTVLKTSKVFYFSAISASGANGEDDPRYSFESSRFNVTAAKGEASSEVVSESGLPASGLDYLWSSWFASATASPEAEIWYTTITSVSTFSAFPLSSLPVPTPPGPTPDTFPYPPDEDNHNRRFYCDLGIGLGVGIPLFCILCAVIGLMIQRCRRVYAIPRTPGNQGRAVAGGPVNQVGDVPEYYAPVLRPVRLVRPG